MNISVSLPLVLAAIWALAATVTALLPMRLQVWSGIPLLVAAPVLLVWIGYEHGIWWVAIGLLAVLSMFRNPLLFLGRRALGLPITLPPGLTERDLSPRMKRMLPREVRDKLAEPAPKQAQR